MGHGRFGSGWNWNRKVTGFYFIFYYIMFYFLFYYYLLTGITVPNRTLSKISNILMQLNLKKWPINYWKFTKKIFFHWVSANLVPLTMLKCHRGLVWVCCVRIGMGSEAQSRFYRQFCKIYFDEGKRTFRSELSQKKKEKKLFSGHKPQLVHVN